MTDNPTAQELKALKEERQYRVSRFREVEQLAGIGSWDMRLDDGSVHWSVGLYHLLGYVPEETQPDMSLLTQLLDETEREHLSGAMQKVFVEGGKYQFETQFTNRNGQVLHAEIVLRLISESGEAKRLIGLVRDQTEKRKNQQQLFRLSTFASDTSDGIVFLKTSGEIEWVNRGFTLMTGHTEKAVVGTDVLSLLPALQLANNPEEIREADEQELRFTRQDGAQRWLNAKLVKSFNYTLDLSGLILVLRDITERKEQALQLEQQKKEIEDKNEKITNSIRYAKRIQEALIGKPEQIDRLFPQSFIFYQPRDIVSGDFYWMEEINGTKVIVVADCTGHGVPGAFMTVLGVSLLNQIVREKKITKPAEVLEQLDQQVQETLHTESSGRSDGMDIAILKVCPHEQKVSFAGAKNPLYRVRNGVLTSVKGSRRSVGGTSRLRDHIPFKTHTFDYQPNDRYYLFSDGFPDQFGHEDGTKFMKKRLRQEISSLTNVPMSQQKEYFQDTFEEWKGNTRQIDDVILMGIEF